MPAPSTYLPRALFRSRVRGVPHPFEWDGWGTRPIDASLYRQWYCDNALIPRGHRVKRPAAKAGLLRWTSRPLQPWSRHIITAKPVTNVHSSTDIPQHAKSLHEALSGLEKAAYPYIDVSRIKLAIRGLESKDAVTRVAILGAEDDMAARRLARVLLADPLTQEAEWETQLIGTKLDGKAYLLRYNKQAGVDDQHPLIKTLFVPSNLLLNNQLEIFIKALPERASGDLSYIDSLLVPGLHSFSASSLGTKPATTTFPVNKTMVVMTGFHQIQYAAGIALERHGQLIKGLINGDWHGDFTARTPADRVTNVLLNISTAEGALETIRSSMDQSFTYEHAWYDSGVPPVRDWLVDGSLPESPTSLKPIMPLSIQQIITATVSGINEAENTARTEAARESLPETTRKALAKEVDAWSVDAHAEYQNRFKEAFESKTWQRLKWYRLLLNVDDVPDDVKQIVTETWFPDTERSLQHLCGRLTQAGLIRIPQSASSNDDEVTDVEDPSKIPSSSKKANVAERGNRIPTKAADQVSLTPEGLPSEASLSTTTKRLDVDFSRSSGPLMDRAFSHTRQLILGGSLNVLVPFANRYVSSAWMTILLSNGASALLYLGLQNANIYEAGVVAALGTVIALRRLQSQWEGVQASWRREFEDRSLDALREVQERLRLVLEPEYGKVKVDEQTLKEMKRAKEAVEKVKVELQKVQEQSR